MKSEKIRELVKEEMRKFWDLKIGEISGIWDLIVWVGPQEFEQSAASCHDCMVLTVLTIEVYRGQ